MIERKPIPPTQPSPIEPSLPSARTSRSIPHSPDDIRGIPSPVSPTLQQQQEYHDAPEVVPGTAPEHIPDHERGDYAGEKLTVGPDTNPSSGPQAVYDDSMASQAQTVIGSSPVHGSINSDPKSAPQALNPTLYGGSEAKGEEAKAEKRPWWKRKIILLIIFFAVLLVIGLGVGLGLGLTHNNGGGGDNQGSPDENDDTSMSCDGGLCPAVLSTTIHDGQLNVFARTSSHDIAVRTHDGERWSSGWVNLGSTPDGSNIVSQPVSVTWEVDGGETPRLDLFVVSSSGRSGNRVYGRHKNGTDGRWSDWTDLGAGAGSSVQVCRARSESIYLWTVDEESRNITQNYWVPTSNAEAKRKRQTIPPDDEEEEEDENEPDEDEPDEDEPDEDEDGNTTPPPNNNNPDPGNSTEPGNWAFTADEPWIPAADPAQGPAASAPGIACRSSSISHDLIWYDANTNLAWHQSYNDTSSSWSDRRSFEGAWVGTPSIFSYTSLSTSSTEEDEPQRFDFFGVQDNKQVYTFSWSSASDYSRMTTLNGSIISTPTSIALSPSTRDIFALGSNGNLHHQHYDGTGWQSEWEDLDIEAWSAPSAVVSDDGDAWLFWLGEGGSLMAGRMQKDEGSSGGGGAKWADQLVVDDLGGDLTLEYFIMEE